MTDHTTPPDLHQDGRVTLSVGGTLRGIRRLLPISVFVVPFGMAVGVAAAETGMPVVQSLALSALVFSGSAQFASLDFWSEPMAFGSLALILLAVNARLIIMGAALAPWLNKVPLGRRVLAMSLLTDINFADSHAAFRAGERDVGIFLGGGLVLWVAWLIGTAVGGLAGSLIGTPEHYGLDVVMVCFFASFVAGRLNERSTLVPAIIAAIVAVATLGWLPTGWNIILAAVAGGIAGTVIRAR